VLAAGAKAAADAKVAAVGLVAATIDGDLTLLIQLRLAHIASHRVGNRPGRVQPHAVKRRPKPHKLLTEPRDATRAKLLAGKST
jgi:hypothetical protein